MQQPTKKAYIKPKLSDYGDLVEMTAITVRVKTCPDALRGGGKLFKKRCPASA